MNFLHKCQSCVFIVHKCMYFSLYPIYLFKKTLLIKLLFHFIFNNFSLNLNNWETTRATKDTPYPVPCAGYLCSYNLFPLTLNNWETTLATRDTPCLVQGIFVVITFFN